MIVPTVQEQLAALREAAAHARGAPFEATTTPARRAEVLTYVANRLELFASKAAAGRQS